ncbi:hypothetical protein BDV95DRAFT_555912 [Massariosphaeria phaeospora]|uniref:Uncharacterized protein n=1 Tax=Massariosphaeria phaeospora TaxID=100035 RepID=A0A7C8IEP9_9PLEO|nr:hypothetical protein BDV95DRAFT_555912 [Massariosphaeria phaeospora]
MLSMLEATSFAYRKTAKPGFVLELQAFRTPYPTITTPKTAVTLPDVFRCAVLFESYTIVSYVFLFLIVNTTALFKRNIRQMKRKWAWNMCPGDVYNRNLVEDQDMSRKGAKPSTWKAITKTQETTRSGMFLDRTKCISNGLAPKRVVKVDPVRVRLLRKNRQSRGSMKPRVLVCLLARSVVALVLVMMELTSPGVRTR